MNNLSDYKYPEFNEDFEGMIPQSGGGGGGGNVLTLYGRMEEETLVVYIDPEYTKEQFDTYQEAADAVMGADIIKLVFDVVEKGATLHNCQFAQNIVCNENSDVTVSFFVKDDCTLWQEELGPIDSNQL